MRVKCVECDKGPCIDDQIGVPCGVYRPKRTKVAGDKCKGLTGALFGHRFEARSDEDNGEGRWPMDSSSMESQISSTNPVLVAELVAQSKSSKSTYVHDICTRCGKVVKRGA